MQTILNANLQPYHTFSIHQQCDVLVEVNSVDDVINVYQNPDWANLPKLIVGKGSNILFTEHFHGVVIVNRLLGKSYQVKDDAYHLHIDGGEDWPSLVEWSIENGMGGLENLALIPGCAGSAPIQNIGAYGVELQDVCDYVDILCLDDFVIKRLSKEECQFGYRDSIFKHELYDRAFVVALGIKLPRSWQANIKYGPLQNLANDQVTSKAIFDVICKTRLEKLPDPELLGNAGSFFKNPVITKDQFDRLVSNYPNVPAYPADGKVKIAAGWLIDQCGLKGVMFGGAQVHPNQALVLVNKDQATSRDVIELANHVVITVLNKFGIKLEHEVRFMGQSEETTLAHILGQG
ncbi:UDP-N-acetylenolpyruvoylglucosamine reductase [Vibrio sp. 10N.286.49.B3]|uniref:UDP-N-acetylmuramate dehydrogenase n=1 Tax=Vibrio sp. 10N.286.49.B3 TaxID=1880855 RepID=UPI000C860C53|nr:UDP-N-acetylmuramate dehydrogenase [Vibrio sp. 10N.286.49.B3]PMH37142.1 UDP-N-acetylenolpyruvoylglucosamine reductase [Vibrio sp. 10N.286.49.B3]